MMKPQNWIDGLIATVAAVLLGGGAVRAEFVNGGFENGSFTGWDTTGNVAVVGSLGPITPSGAFMAFLQNATPSSSPAAVNTFLNLPANFLQGQGVPNLDNTISAIAQDVTVSAGDTLTFQWKFLTNDFTPDPVFNDFSFVSITTPTGPAAPPVLFSTLADTFSAFGPAPGSTFLEQSPAGDANFGTFAFTFATAGTFRVGVGVADRGDVLVNSGLLADDFQITAAVPEPASLALLGLGTLGLIGCRRLFGRREKD